MCTLWKVLQSVKLTLSVLHAELKGRVLLPHQGNNKGPKTSTVNDVLSQPHSRDYVAISACSFFQFRKHCYFIGYKFFYLRHQKTSHDKLMYLLHLRLTQNALQFLFFFSSLFPSPHFFRTDLQNLFVYFASIFALGKSDHYRT